MLESGQKSSVKFVGGGGGGNLLYNLGKPVPGGANQSQEGAKAPPPPLAPPEINLIRTYFKRKARKIVGLETRLKNADLREDKPSVDARPLILLG